MCLADDKIVFKELICVFFISSRKCLRNNVFGVSVIVVVPICLVDSFKCTSMAFRMTFRKAFYNNWLRYFSGMLKRKIYVKSCNVENEVNSLDQ